MVAVAEEEEEAAAEDPNMLDMEIVMQDGILLRARVMVKVVSVHQILDMLEDMAKGVLAVVLRAGRVVMYQHESRPSRHRQR